MLTRKGVKAEDDATSEENDTDWDEYMSMSPQQLQLLEADLDAEMEELHRDYERLLRQMNRMERYRHERQRALINILRSRDRIDRFKVLNAPEIIIGMQREFIKSKQKELVSLRWRFRTGLSGGRA